ncbi:MAG: hypothetical protein P1U63_05000 [Coxiellaceae bacterium]|nr:hypothetical protein [Coxiellaceae bacterium]
MRKSIITCAMLLIGSSAIAASTVTVINDSTLDGNIESILVDYQGTFGGPHGEYNRNLGYIDSQRQMEMRAPYPLGQGVLKKWEIDAIEPWSNQTARIATESCRKLNPVPHMGDASSSNHYTVVVTNTMLPGTSFKAIKCSVTKDY